MNAQPFVLVEDDRPARWLTLSRPERKNAVAAHGWDEIAAGLDSFAESPQRVVVLTGAGGDFCSGAIAMELARELAADRPGSNSTGRSAEGVSQRPLTLVTCFLV